MRRDIETSLYGRVVNSRRLIEALELFWLSSDSSVLLPRVARPGRPTRRCLHLAKLRAEEQRVNRPLRYGTRPPPVVHWRVVVRERRVSSDPRDRLQSSLGAGYRLSRELGGGGMAKVYVADDPALGRRVVVKVLAPDLAAGVDIDRFKREIQVAGSLHHPRIVPVLSAGQSGDELLYYTMPFIEGESLRALIDRERQLSLDQALAITRDVADALEYAHAQNIVHRDIKPGNILIERESGRAVVTDFGIARAIERAADISTVTSTGFTLGTPTYMSPEQAGAEKEIDGRSDIYSLGCVLYEMLAGTPPFVAPTARALIARHMTEPPPSVLVVRPDLPSDTQRLLEHMLAKTRAGRLSDAATLIHAIDDPQRLPPVGASPRRVVVRRIALAGAIAIILAGVIMLLALLRSQRG